MTKPRMGKAPLPTTDYTATDTVQNVTGIPEQGLVHLHLHLDSTAVVGSGKKIRIAINGAPSGLSGAVGFIVDEDHHFVMDGHTVYSISYIRHSGEISDVTFSIMGLY